MHKLGVIGGMGPGATAYFFQRLTALTQADKDQGHLETVIISVPSVPDRTAYLLDQNEQNPVPFIIDVGQTLARLGCTCIAIPCVTAHYFYDELAAQITVPVIHMVNETAAALRRDGVQCAGLLATAGTVATGLFQKALSQAGIETVVPAPTAQSYVSDAIYEGVKAGKPVDIAIIDRVADGLRTDGAETVVLGCTELSLLFGETRTAGYTDALEILALAALRYCGVAVRAGV